jgi:hypothetical protein
MGVSTNVNHPQNRNRPWKQQLKVQFCLHAVIQIRNMRGKICEFAYPIGSCVTAWHAEGIICCSEATNKTATLKHNDG